MVPAVAKALEVALLVLLVGLLGTALFGSVLPEYRTAAGAELGDRTLARSAAAVESATPAGPVAGLDRTRRVDLPDRIRGEPYAVRATGGALRLDHPAAGVGGRVRLALPNGTTVAGSWRSGAPARVRVRSTDDGVAVRLTGGER